MDGILSDAWDGLRDGARDFFGSISGEITVGGGQEPAAAFSFGRSGSALWLAVIAALLLGVWLGGRR